MKKKPGLYFSYLLIRCFIHFWGISEQRFEDIFQHILHQQQRIRIRQNLAATGFISYALPTAQRYQPWANTSI